MTGHHLQITRVKRPAEPTASHVEETGGQWEWSWAVPLPYRVLAAPHVRNPMPVAPRAGVDFTQFLGYWTTLQSLLTYSFGWTRHDRGLRWWIESGMPRADLRFELIHEVWHRDGNLVAYAEWYHDRLWSFSHQALAQWTKYDATPDSISPELEREFARARNFALELSPHGKHLEGGDHANGPAAEGYRSTLTVANAEQRRATYVSDGVLGWYRGLTELGNGLPSLGDASWYVDVFVKPIGYVGRFRRSRQTRLWFSGKHRYHVVGV